ncbi:MAG: PepSY-associated TM helix domain-containing protein [Pseudomonadota bacterium]
MRRIAVGIHRYLGLVLGSLLLVSGLTGSAIVFKAPLDAWLNPELIRVTPRQDRVALDQILTSVRQALPNEQANVVFMPDSPAQALEIWFKDSDLRAYVDPYTGAVRGVRHATHSLMGFLVDLHIHLLSGETGEQVMGWSGLGAIVLSLLGLWLWWPKAGRWKQAFSVKWQAAPVRIWLDLHKLAGVMICGFLILTAATGASLALYDIFTEPALIAFTGEGTRRAPPASRKTGGMAAPLAPMLAHSASLFPDGQITRVSLPARPGVAVMVRMRLAGEIHQFGRTFIWFDQYDGAVLRVDNALLANRATRIQSWLYPLHTGVYGGNPTRWLQVVIGLSLTLLTLSGAWLWFRGYRARAIGAERKRASRMGRGER